MYAPRAAPKTSLNIVLVLATVLLTLLALAPAAGAAAKRGTSGSDALFGTAKGERISGLAGADRLFGRGGSDTLDGGAGNDLLDGGRGSDVIRGGTGDDALRGGPGDDVLLGGAGRDRIVAGPGDDQIGAADGSRDVIDCGPGKDDVIADRFDLVGEDCEVPKALNLTITGSGTGVVRDVASGRSCPPACVDDDVPFGTAVDLVAEPDESSEFAGWTGDCASGASTCHLELSDDATVTARFLLRQVPIAVTRSGAGRGAVTTTPAVLDCGDACTATVGWGTTVVFTAVPSAGSSFAGWGGACLGLSVTCVLQARGGVQVDAAFAAPGEAAPSTQRLEVAVSAGGRVVSEPAGLTCAGAATCAVDFPTGAQLVLRPEPDPGYAFAGWTGMCTPALDACRIDALTEPLAVAATFTPLPAPTLKVVLEGTPAPWWLVLDDLQPHRILCPLVCEATYDRGSTVRLTWVAAMRLVAEEGCMDQDARSSRGWCDVTMDADRTVVLRFKHGEARPYR